MRNGFTLLEAVIVLGIIAVLAGVMVPSLIGRIDDARMDAAERELDSIESALEMYHRDCKDLPSEANGLGALVSNLDGVPGWRGPYVNGRGDQAVSISTDPWGNAYLYAPFAQVRGYGYVVDYLLACASDDHVLDTVMQGQRWRVDERDDLVRIGALAETNAEWVKETESRLRLLEQGFTRYYTDVGTFPSGNDATAVGELLSSGATGWAGPYVPGLASTVTQDAWERAIQVRPCTRVDGEAVTGWILWSDGPGAPSAQVTGGGTRWRTAPNDVFVVIRQSSLDAERVRVLRDEARRQLRVLSGRLYANNPAGSPASYTLAELDPWGRRYEYKKESDYSGVLHSRGPDGADQAGAGDDDAEALLWHP